MSPAWAGAVELLIARLQGNGWLVGRDLIAIALAFLKLRFANLSELWPTFNGDLACVSLCAPSTDKS